MFNMFRYKKGLYGEPIYYRTKQFGDRVAEIDFYIAEMYPKNHYVWVAFGICYKGEDMWEVIDDNEISGDGSLQPLLFALKSTKDFIKYVQNHPHRFQDTVHMDVNATDLRRGRAYSRLTRYGFTKIDKYEYRYNFRR